MLREISLQDKYTQNEGRIFLNGTQVLVKLPLLQRELDRRAGLNTAGFISGYRGSPLGGYDMMLAQAQKHLAAHQIHFQLGINEDLGATAVWGSQQVPLFQGANVQGAFGIWYGKGPGVDRTGDVFKHANAAGTSQFGGVLALAGDDHNCKSSTLPHQSEYGFMDASIPVLYPSTIQDVLDLGIYGWALSRYSGCWVAFKVLADTVDTSATVDVSLDKYKIIIPDDFDMPEGGLNIRWPDVPLEQEKRLQQYKLKAAQAFVRANKLDRVIVSPKDAKLGIVTAGKNYQDVLQAFSILNIDAERDGIAVYKVAVNWPLEPQGIVSFCSGLDEVFVVEEKRPVLEGQIKDILYGLPESKRPRIVGKYDHQGQVLLTPLKDLDASKVAIAIARRMQVVGIRLDEMARAEASIMERLQESESREASLLRIPYYCSGCPHNTSTPQLPEGSRAVAGIGCHYMATWIVPETTQTFTQMGGEGVPWIGQAPFTSEKHIFSNLGDGTYFHSGSLAIRASIAAGVNITYKILYNDAVAMTGGQAVDGELTVASITHQMRAEGIAKIVVVTDEPDKYGLSGFASGVTIHHRDQLAQVQDDIRLWPGVSIIIYDQTCAAEKRRRRKRGLMIDPPKRIFINDKVCEGCGDCGKKSNCLSIVPIETALGRKRKIDQSSCNKDYSCVNGFCPSFVSVEGGKVRRKKATLEERLATLPTPNRPQYNGKDYSIYLTGIGGTGVVTIGALLGMASHLEGHAASMVDMAGLAQKGGSVVSHIRLAAKPEDIKTTRISLGEADLILGTDIVVTSDPDTLAVIDKGRTKLVVNEDQTITGQFTQNPDYDFHHASLKRTIESTAGGTSHVAWIRATALATTLLGDSIATNLFMLGYAYQRGWIPVSHEAIEAAIELNAVAVPANLLAFRWGRLAAIDYDYVTQIVLSHQGDDDTLPETLEGIIDYHYKHLQGYQNTAYAERYKSLVLRVRAKDTGAALTKAVAQSYVKVLAYKDEYEVARLYTDGSFLDKLHEQFEGDLKLTFHLAPPLIAPKDPRTGHLRKITFGPWMLKAFGVLKHFKGLRGTPFDIFGLSDERKKERAMISEYEALVGALLKKLNDKNYTTAVALAELPQSVRGFGHVKEENRLKAQAQREKLLKQL